MLHQISGNCFCWTSLDLRFPLRLDYLLYNMANCNILSHDLCETWLLKLKDMLHGNLFDVCTRHTYWRINNFIILSFYIDYLKSTNHILYTLYWLAYSSLYKYVSYLSLERSRKKDHLHITHLCLIKKLYIQSCNDTHLTLDFVTEQTVQDRHM